MTVTPTPDAQPLSRVAQFIGWQVLRAVGAIFPMGLAWLIWNLPVRWLFPDVHTALYDFHGTDNLLPWLSRIGFYLGAWLILGDAIRKHGGDYVRSYFVASMLVPFAPVIALIAFVKRVLGGARS